MYIGVPKSLEDSTLHHVNSGGMDAPDDARSTVATRVLTSEAHAYVVCLLGNLLDVGVASDADRASAIHEVPLHLDSPIVQVGCGRDWICLLASSGRAYSCGCNTYGQLGQGRAVCDHDAPLVPRPLQLPPSVRVARIASGTSHGGFVTDRGALFMFGCSSYGRLGTGAGAGSANVSSLGDQFVPVQVRMTWSALQAKAARLSAAVHCGIPVVVPKLETAVLSSGDSARAQPTETNEYRGNDAVDKDDDVVFVDISCGDRHTIVLGGKRQGVNEGGAITLSSLSKTSIISFGDGMNGRLGIGNEFDQRTGALVTTFKAPQPYMKSLPLPKITAISAGDAHNAALTASGELYTWGTGADGQLGHGNCESEWVPRQVDFFQTIALAAVKCGARHTLAVTHTGVVYTWGRGLEGQLGTGAEATTLPQRVHLAMDPLAVHQMAIDAQVHAAATTTASSLPSATLLSQQQQQHLQQQHDLRVTVRAIAARANVCMVLDTHARLFSWGSDSEQQLGFPLDDVELTESRCLRKRRNHDSNAALDDSTGSTSTLPAAVAWSSGAVVAPRQLLYAKLGGASAQSKQLVHFDASDRFTMLVFKVDPKAILSMTSGSRTARSCRQQVIGGSSGATEFGSSDTTPRMPSASLLDTSDGGASQRGERLTGDSEPECSTAANAQRKTTGSGRWQLSPLQDLRPDDVPSKENEYFQFMVNYKVHIRSQRRGTSGRTERMASERTVVDLDRCDNGIDEREEPAGALLMHANPGRRLRLPPDNSRSWSRRGLSSRQASSSCDWNSAEEKQSSYCGDAHPTQRPSATPVNGQPTKPPQCVRGMERWLETRSPAKPSVQCAFGVAKRFTQQSEPNKRSSNNHAKADEVQEPVCVEARTLASSTSPRTSGSASRVTTATPSVRVPPNLSLETPPTRPKSAFGRTLHTALSSHRIDALVSRLRTPMANSSSGRSARLSSHSNRVAPASTAPSARAKPVRAASASAANRHGL